MASEDWTGLSLTYLLSIKEIKTKLDTVLFQLSTTGQVLYVVLALNNIDDIETLEILFMPRHC